MVNQCSQNIAVMEQMMLIYSVCIKCMLTSLHSSDKEDEDHISLEQKTLVLYAKNSPLK